MNKPLHDAVYAGDLETLTRLLYAGGDVNDVGTHRWTLLTHAAVERQIEVIRLLISRGAEVDRIDFPDRRGRVDGKTALHWAAMFGRVESVRVLLELGANADRHDIFGEFTPLHLCVNHAKEEFTKEIVRLLLDYGADINARNKFGNTALLTVVLRASNSEFAWWLVWQGASPTVRDGEGSTLLIFLCKMPIFSFVGREPMIAFLLEMGIDINAQDNSGKTALMWATIKRNEEDIPMLKRYGADPNLRDNGEHTAYDHALLPTDENCEPAILRRLHLQKHPERREEYEAEDRAQSERIASLLQSQDAE